MNYYQPRELKGSDGKGNGLFHYTVRNDNRIFAVGYCAEGCDGHPTEEAARRHYTEYLLDNRLQLDLQLTGQQRRCEVCGEWTQGLARVDHSSSWPLCDQHRTREAVAVLFGTVGDMISSW